MAEVHYRHHHVALARRKGHFALYIVYGKGPLFTSVLRYQVALHA